MENNRNTSHDDELYVTNVKLYVKSTRCNDNLNLIEQIHPALLIRSSKAILKVVKHIYNHLATNPHRTDEPFPDIIISLISGKNVVDLQVINSFQIF